MKVLVVGSGGREHAIVRALLRSPQAPDIVCTPGNAGITRDVRTALVGAGDVEGLVTLALAEHPDLVVVGPEVPLVAGLADALTDVGIAVFGPVAAAARLEGSKAFAKEVMTAAGVPTAGYTRVQAVDAGMAAITGYPAVIKCDGLAAGKGVVIAADEDAAREALTDMLERHVFGDVDVIVEEHLLGEELSLLAICDGELALPMDGAQDYKRIFDGDEGPNTGGMGSYSPVPGIDAARVAELSAIVHQPIVDELARRGTPFHGILYAGLMMTADGPRVIEYNVRFGDPETQALLPRLRSDLLDLMLRATRRGGLAGAVLEWDARWAVSVVLASRGYPASSSSGDAIAGLEEVGGDAEVTHAGTSLAGGAVVTAGGRVLNVTALGDGPAQARDAAYAAADRITFEGRQMRRDIALRAVERVS
ncbi:MAG TPA: phosphoribosylamine--glycine ligase [Solirubrobacteraceae bacterium]|nr:phosphoribosylamine--glycine ligase [Solirubrobacteraceae bacterium]